MAEATIQAKPFDPTQIPQVVLPKHPCRYSIEGTVHTIADLKTIVQDDPDLSDALKDFLASELDAVKSNAAELDLHLVDQPQGGISLHIHIAPRHLGSRPKVSREPNPPPGKPKVDSQEILK